MCGAVHPWRNDRRRPLQVVGCARVSAHFEIYVRLLNPLLCTLLPQMAKRRLSVAPQLAGLSALTGSPLLDNKEDANLSAIEVQAKGKLKHAMVSKKGLVPYNKNKGQSYDESRGCCVTAGLLHGMPALVRCISLPLTLDVKFTVPVDSQPRSICHQIRDR